MAEQQFGGGWTQKKLVALEKYLRAYVQIMKDRRFHYEYIDAFAGTGWYEEEKSEIAPLFERQDESEPLRFLDGSARIALRITPPFMQYTFIEKLQSRATELENLKQEFPQLADRIQIHVAEANAFIQNICSVDWRKASRRAVMFLDPFGMQVEWKTIVAVANTKAIDLWLLFPHGIAINRMLARDGRIPDSWRKRLDAMFGGEDWFDNFYRRKTESTLFGNEDTLQKTGDFKAIGSYFVRKLELLFAGVAQKPLELVNTSGSPLFLLCFAAGNPKGAPTAVKIAQDILSR